MAMKKKRKGIHITTTHRDCGACPQCGYRPDCHTNAPLHLKYASESEVDEQIDAERNSTPETGGWSVCCDCATILRYDDNVQLRRAMPHELITLQGESREFFLGLMDVVDMVRDVKAKIDKPGWEVKFA